MAPVNRPITSLVASGVDYDDFGPVGETFRPSQTRPRRVNQQQRKIAITNNKKSKTASKRKQDRPVKLKSQDRTLALEVVHPKAARIDVVSLNHWVAIGLDREPVRRFDCFTADMEALGLVVGPSDHHSGHVFLVNARNTRNVPGRKTDVLECQRWLKLHVYGLLNNSFLPEEKIKIMRTYWRHRQQQHIVDAGPSTQRMQKAMTQAAGSLLKSQSYLGARFRRLRTKLGAPKAIKAMAAKLARLVYRMLQYGQTYVDKGSQYYAPVARKLENLD